LKPQISQITQMIRVICAIRGCDCYDANVREQLIEADVIVVGGGNAGLCAALVARELGVSVAVLESAPFHYRGGNSRHTRNMRCMHDGPTDVLTETYSTDEYLADLLRVTGGQTTRELAQLVIRESPRATQWMSSYGVRFQPSLGGTLHLGRTNAFFLVAAKRY
jgi:tricarballylate dehydrogenase